MPRLRDRQRGRPQVLPRVRLEAGRRVPVLRDVQPAPGALLRGVRHSAPERRGGRGRCCKATGRDPGRSGRRIHGQPQEAPVAERRLVTVLFADLVGFTTLAEGRDAGGGPRAADALLRPRARRSSSATAARSRSSSATRSWPSGARPSPTRTTPSARSAPRSSSSTPSAALGPGHPGAGRRPDRRGRGHARRRRTRAWSPATSSTPRRGSSRSPPPGTVLVGEATHRAAAQRDRVRGGRRAGAQGQGRARRRRGGRAGRRRARRPRPRRTRSRRRSSAATTSCACSRTCSTPPARERRPRLVSVIGPAGHRQEPPRLGVPRSTSTASSRRSAGTTGRSPAYGEGITFWALGEMVRGRARPARDRRRADDAREGRRDARRVRPRRGRAALDRAGAAGAARRRRRAGRRSRASCSRRGGRSSSGSPRRARSCSCSRTSTGPTPACSTSSTTCSSGAADVPIFDRHARPAGAARAAPGLGRRQAQLHRRSTSSRSPRRRCASCSPGSSRACPTTAVAAIVARADGIPLYAVETVRMLVADGRLVARGRRLRARSATSTTLAVPETLHALIAARLDALDAGRPGARSRTRPCSARASRSPAWPRSSGLGRVGARAAAARRSSGASCSRHERRPAVAGARPVRVRPGAHPRGRLRHAGQARPPDAPPRGRALLRVARRGRARRRPRRALPRRLRGGAGRAGGRRPRGPGPARAACGPPIGPRRSAHPSRRSRS